MGAVFVLLGFLVGLFDLLWAIVLILLGVLILSIGISVMAPEPPVVVQQQPSTGQMPPGTPYYPSAGYSTPSGLSPPQNPGLQTHREVITREIVKVPCRNCGTLVELTAPRCPSCSAPVR